MTEQDLRAVAEEIARDLFTNGCGDVAQRLVLTVDTPTPRNLGGWCERAVADRIELVLTLRNRGETL